MRNLAHVRVFAMALALAAAAALTAIGQRPLTAPRNAQASKTFDSTQSLPLFRFQNFTTADGLPDNHVFAVLVDGDRIWAGTENGVGLYENGKWKTFTTKDGLAHRAVLSLALDKRTGDVWAGTMGGFSRISGGRIDTYTQLNSGLSNDVVYGVSVEGENVWVATAAGACRLNLRTGQWSLYNERNTPMREIWVYGVSATARQSLLRGVGQRPSRIQPEDRSLGQVRRPRRRNRDRVVQGSGTDSRHYHVRSAMSTTSSGWRPTSATAVTTAATGITS